METYDWLIHSARSFGSAFCGGLAGGFAGWRWPGWALTDDRLFQKPKIECREHQDDADVCGEAFPEAISKEEQIHANDHGDHCQKVNHGMRVFGHFSFVANASRTVKAMPNPAMPPIIRYDVCALPMTSVPAKIA